jgi:hypothetical protein
MERLGDILIDVAGERGQAYQVSPIEAERDIKQMLLDLIGPDERIEYHELPSVITRNELREELRKKVKEF